MFVDDEDDNEIEFDDFEFDDVDFDDFDDVDDEDIEFNDLEDLDDEDIEIDDKDLEDLDDIEDEDIEIDDEDLEDLDDIEDEDVEIDDENLEDIDDLDELDDEDIEIDDEDLEDLDDLDDIEDEDIEIDDEDLEDLDDLDDIEDEDIEIDDEDLEDIDDLDEIDDEDIEIDDEDLEDIDDLDEIEDEDEDIEEEIEEDEEDSEEIQDDETEEEVVESKEELEEKARKAEEEADMEKMTDLQAEYIFLGLLLDNPKAISRYYFVFDECHFSEQQLDNVYRSIIFKDAEQYAPAIAKEGFKLPFETGDLYDFKGQLKEIARERNYSIELVYTLLKKLFILKKYYLMAPTKLIRDNIVNITNYKLYNEMTVEEVESAIEQIGVTSGLSQGRLNQDATKFLLDDQSTLVTGADLPFPILSSVFKGIRKGETFVYAMPSNSGKSRLTINMASYLAFTQNKKVLIISNEMSIEKMKLCLITTILNNKSYQKLHGQDLLKSENDLLDLKFKPDKKRGVKVDSDGNILREDNESMEEFIERLSSLSSEFNKTIKATEWLNEQIENSIYFIHITDHTNEDLRKIIMNYYYRENVEYIFYDTLKADTDNIGNGDEVKKTATILSNLAQKFEMFIGSSMQLIESSTLPVNLTVNEMSASRTVKEVLDTLCLMKQINPQTLSKYEYSPIQEAKEYKDLEVFDDPDVRYYVCVVDKNRAGAKPTLLFRLNLAYNTWEELGYVRLKQEFVSLD